MMNFQHLAFQLYGKSIMLQLFFLVILYYLPIILKIIPEVNIMFKIIFIRGFC